MTYRLTMMDKHLPGMYSDKYVHRRVQCEQGRYITIGDPYRDGHKVPGRWKKKQMSVEAKPQNAGGGYFGLMGKPFTYVPSGYAERAPGKAKLGFGSGSRRDARTGELKPRLPVVAPVPAPLPTPHRFLYDIGKSRQTKFDPKLPRDRFFNVLELRRGPYRTASQDIGDGAWTAPPQESRGKSHATRTFYSRGHLDIGDL